MSTVPPNVPPGGGAPPPYPPIDPKMQWKMHRAQQKAAWNAQRVAWKAQRAAWKAGMGGPYVPRVPSLVGPVVLIGIGVVALLLMTGMVPSGQFWVWYARWWPLVLIGAGLALLGEWAIDLRRQTPVRRSGGFVGLLILLAILGMCAQGWNNGQPWSEHSWFNHFGGDDFGVNNDFFNSFGLPEHSQDAEAQYAQLQANSVVQIENPRGDVSVTAAEVSTIEVQAHEVAYANSDEEAKKIYSAEAPHITVSGTAVMVKSESNEHGRVNLTVTVPKTARVNLNSGKGDVNAAELNAGLTLTARGDVHLSSINGPVQASLTDGKHDVSANRISGDLTLNGDCEDLTVSEVGGKLSQQGEILGDVHIENIHQSVHLHTAKTDLELSSLPGDLTLNPDDLRVTGAKGPVHVVTRSKDIDLSQIEGDSYVEDRDGRIAVEPAGNYGVEAKNGKGDVEVTLAPNASASVAANTRNGDVVSDFTMPSPSEGATKTVTFRIGGGAARLMLSAENGDVRIKRGTGNVAPAIPAAPATPAAPGAQHLKPTKGATAQAVTQ